MFIRKHIVGILRDWNCWTPLIIAVVGLGLRGLSLIGPPTQTSLETIAGVILDVQVVSPPRTETRMEITLETGRSTETLYVRRFAFLTDRAPLLKTLSRGQTVSARFCRDNLGRSFLECWQLVRGNETIFSYEDMVWGHRQSDLSSNALGDVIAIWGLVVYVILVILKKREIDRSAEDTEGENITCPWLNYMFGGIVYLSMCLGIVFVWYQQHLIGQDIWWLLALSLLGLGHSFYRFVQVVRFIPLQVALRDEGICIRFAFREAIDCRYVDIETVDSRKTFWKGSSVTILIQPGIQVLLGKEGVTNLELFLERLRKKNPQCTIL